LQDASGPKADGRIQLFIATDLVGAETQAAFKHYDLGDILGAEGVLFKTKTGELSVKVSTLRLLTKSLRPLPDKHHGLSDQETKYRQRYVDLIMSEDTRRTFKARTAAMSSIRNFMAEHDFMEVETPMLHAIPGGAAAKPFITHHNALDMQMFLRIAPELYLKRLVVGGFERVFEVNRNFRNEGVSPRHNPEFTMMESIGYDANVPEPPALALFTVAIGGLFAGLFWGRTLRQFQRALQADGRSATVVDCIALVVGRRALREA